MRCIERCPDSFLALLGGAAVLVALPMLPSCIVEERIVEVPSDHHVVDASTDAVSTPAAESDASPSDAGAVPVDASRPPAPVVSCPTSGRCALALRAPADSAVTSVAEAFCALLSSGKVACWGTNSRGELGRTTLDASAGVLVGTPGLVDGVENATDIDRNCALVGNGDVFCWGQLAIPGVSAGTAPLAGPTKLPIPPAKKISISSKIGCALLSNDHVSCWGRDPASGQLDFAASRGADGGVYGAAEVPIASGARVVGVGAGERIGGVGGATYVLREDGTALSWGSNISLGRTSSLIPDPAPAIIELEDVQALSVAGPAACAITRDGKVSCWGTSVGAPKTVQLDDAVQVATAGPRPLGRACAVVRSGDVHCWGDNDAGQAGDGTQTFAANPVKVAGLPSAAVAVEVTMKSSCAVLVDGRVFCWGDGSRGQLGRELDNSLTPIEITLPEVP